MLGIQDQGLSLHGFDQQDTKVHNKLQYCEEDLVPGKIIAVKLTSDTFGRQLAWDRYSLLNEDNILKLQKELY